MALEVWKDPEQLGGFILCVLTIPMCCVATALRFMASKKTTGRANLESWLAMAALVFFLVYTLMFLYRSSRPSPLSDPACLVRLSLFLTCVFIPVLTVLNGRGLPELMMGPPETIVHVLKVRLFALV